MAPADGAVPALDPGERLLHEEVVLPPEEERTLRAQKKAAAVFSSDSSQLSGDGGGCHVDVVVVGGVHPRVVAGEVRVAGRYLGADGIGQKCVEEHFEPNEGPHLRQPRLAQNDPQALFENHEP